MELVYKKSYPLTQQFMSNFGLVGQLQKTSLFMTLRNMSTRSMMTSWSMEFVGLTNGLITILLSMVMDPQHYQVCVVFSWDNYLLFGIQNSWNWFTAVHYSCTISELATKFHQNGLHYHWWKTPGAYQIYAAGEIYYLSIEAFKKSNCVFLRLLLASPPFPKANFSTLFSLLLICFLNFFSDESGWGIQLDLPPGNPPNNVPNYSAACASDDGCLGQGNCKADFYQRVFNM